ncbi:hypothetical protein ACQ4PT_060941 [Festuca glaucescens]
MVREQLLALVLGSLAVQYFLFFFAGSRKSRIPGWYRFFIWLSYLSSDALAIYALATLFNRRKKLQYHSSDLQVLWAPILLVHLGGQLVITAYNIEDNELWKRHIITSSSQVFVSQLFSTESCDSSKDIIKIVHQHIKDGWEKHIIDAKSYKEFNDIRGQWTLKHKGCDQQLGYSLERPFDRSVLIWHLATDFCFYCRSTSPEHAERAQLCREISNYMIHLLFANPEMLLPGSRKRLLKVAYDELSEVFIGQETPADEGKLAQKVVDTMISREDLEAPFVDEAVGLYTWLIDNDENKMWEVIQGVWVEMLCFSAGRCRGYLHAKSIGAGGEFLSYIWLLLHETGMETFQHRLERTQNVGLSKEKDILARKKKHHLRNQGEDIIASSTYQGVNPSTKGGTSQGMNVPHKDKIVLDQLPDIV